MKRNVSSFCLVLVCIVYSFVFFAEEKNIAVHSIIIIGSGPAGLTAALFAAQMGLSPIVITGKEVGGQLNYAPKITNWPGEISISGKDLADRLYQHAKTAGTQFLNEEVVTVQCLKKPFFIETNAGKKLFCNSMIIATGSKPKLLHIAGEKEYWGNGISTCALCDGMLYKQKNVAIVGNGSIALHNAQHMLEIANHVYIITDKDSFSEGAKQLQQFVINHPKTTIFFRCKPVKFHGTQTSGITQLAYIDLSDKQEKKIDIDGVFVSIGSVPNLDLFADQLKIDVNYKFPKIVEMVKTSIPGIFIAIPTKHQQAIICAGLGSTAALAANHYLKNQNKEVKKHTQQ